MTTKSRFTRLAIILGSTAALGLASCGNDDSSSACPTIESGKLTIATGTPAFEPWVVGDAPESGEGFEAAVAYAVAGELGYEVAEAVAGAALLPEVRELLNRMLNAGRVGAAARASDREPLRGLLQRTHAEIEGLIAQKYLARDGRDLHVTGSGMRLIRVDEDAFVGGRYARETWEITRKEWRRLK